MRLKLVYCVTAIVTIGIAASLLAQQPQGQPGGRGRGGPPGGFGGGFTSRMSLLSIAEVRKELELAEEQITEIEKVAQELREKYPFGGRGGQGGRGGDGRRGPNNNEQGNRTAPTQWYFVQARTQNQPGQDQPRQERGGRPQFTDEQRAEMEKQRLERTREEKAKLAEILLPHQIKRLNEIYIQRAGLSALQDEDTAKVLGISDAQRAKLTEVRRANEEAIGALMRERFQGGGGGGDPEAGRARFEEVRKAGEAKLLAALTPDQQKKFEDMKGKPFAFPEGEGRFVPGGGNRGRGNNN